MWLLEPWPLLLLPPPPRLPTASPDWLQNKDSPVLLLWDHSASCCGAIVPQNPFSIKRQSVVFPVPRFQSRPVFLLSSVYEGRVFSDVKLTPQGDVQRFTVEVCWLHCGVRYLEAWPTPPVPVWTVLWRTKFLTLILVSSPISISDDRSNGIVTHQGFYSCTWKRKQHSLLQTKHCPEHQLVP